MTVVLDTNVVVSGIIWAGSSRRCLVAWARRRFELVITTEILDEYIRTVEIVVQRTGKEINWRPWMQWIKDKAKVTEAAPLGKQRSRDSEGRYFSSVRFGFRSENDCFERQRLTDFAETVWRRDFGTKRVFEEDCRR